jgi:hypothetical protein
MRLESILSFKSLSCLGLGPGSSVCLTRSSGDPGGSRRPNDGTCSLVGGLDFSDNGPSFRAPFEVFSLFQAAECWAAQEAQYYRAPKQRKVRALFLMTTMGSVKKVLCEGMEVLVVLLVVGSPFEWPSVV